MIDAKLHDEVARMAALERYAVLDSPPEPPFDKITALVRNILGVPICAVSLVDRERQWFKSIQGLDARETPRSISFCTHTIQADDPFVVTNALSDPRFNANPLVLGAPHIRSYVGVPLRSPDGYNVGSLCAIDTTTREYNDGQLEILKSFASLVVDELELRRIAERDHLTGALTRRGFVESAKKTIAAHRRHARPSVLLMFDIDHFKSVNDCFGHPTGDKVLKAVAVACQHHLREGDSLGRVGGEEFAVLLTDTESEGGLCKAESLRRTIESMIVEAGEISLTVTASFGVARLDDHVDTPEKWLSIADQALYTAKRGGRNQSVMHSGSCEPVAA